MQIYRDYGVSNALFCRMPSLTSELTQSMRFGSNADGCICKFNGRSSWAGTGDVLETVSTGGIISESFGYTTGEDFYLTFVYTAYDNTKSAEYQAIHYDSTMISENVDKVEYYVNGELLGYTYYGHDSYQEGLATWNTDKCPFFLGACPWGTTGAVTYLKGSVYTTRLYTCSMTAEQVVDNKDMTERYRASF